MKRAEIFKANGITFLSFVEVEKYAAENNFRITNTEVIKIKGRIIHLIDLNK